MFIMTKETVEVTPKQISQADVQKALGAMHHGLLNMQARLDDHEQVLEKLMMVMQNLTAGQVPDGFRQPKKAK